MSVGAICFTSSGSNGGCWVVLVYPPPLFCFLFVFFLKKAFFFPCATYPPKKGHATYTTKKSQSRLFPQLSYAFIPWKEWVGPLGGSWSGLVVPE